MQATNFWRLLLKMSCFYCIFFISEGNDNPVKKQYTPS